MTRQEISRLGLDQITHSERKPIVKKAARRIAHAAGEVKERFNRRKWEIASTIGIASYLGIKDYIESHALRHEILTNAVFREEINHEQFNKAFREDNFPFYIIGSSLALVAAGYMLPYLSPTARKIVVGATLGFITASAIAIETVPLPLPRSIIGTRDKGDIPAGLRGIAAGMGTYSIIRALGAGIELGKHKWQERKTRRANPLFN